MTRLTWKQGRWSERGYAGTLNADVFAISWSTTRGDPKPWVLRCFLPGYLSRRWQFADKDEAKAFAERVLTRFIAYVNAVPPVVPAMDNGEVA